MTAPGAGTDSFNHTVVAIGSVVNPPKISTRTAVGAYPITPVPVIAISLEYVLVVLATDSYI